MSDSKSNDKDLEDVRPAGDMDVGELPCSESVPLRCGLEDERPRDRSVALSEEGDLLKDPDEVAETGSLLDKLRNLSLRSLGVSRSTILSGLKGTHVGRLLEMSVNMVTDGSSRLDRAAEPKEDDENDTSLPGEPPEDKEEADSDNLAFRIPLDFNKEYDFIIEPMPDRRTRLILLTSKNRRGYLKLRIHDDGSIGWSMVTEGSTLLSFAVQNGLMSIWDMYTKWEAAVYGR